MQHQYLNQGQPILGQSHFSSEFEAGTNCLIVWGWTCWTSEKCFEHFPANSYSYLFYEVQDGREVVWFYGGKWPGTCTGMLKKCASGLSKLFSTFHRTESHVHLSFWNKKLRCMTAPSIYSVLYTDWTIGISLNFTLLIPPDQLLYIKYRNHQMTKWHQSRL